MDKTQLLRLRKASGLGFKKCFKALTKANGDFEQAVRLLREEGAKIASKRLNHDTKEGAIFTGTNTSGTVGVMVGLGCETDFVAQNDSFQELGNALLQAALTNQITDKDTLLQTSWKESTFQEELLQLAGRVGEHLVLIAYEYIQAPSVGVYVHTGNKLGAIAALNQNIKDPESPNTIAHNIALHIVVEDPLAIDEKTIDPHLLAKEKAIIETQVAKTQPNPQIASKITANRVAHFLKENMLLSQPFIKNEAITIGEYLQQTAPNLAVVSFKRLQIID